MANNSRVGSDGETDTNDEEAESELTIDMEAGDDGDAEDGDEACHNNNVSEQEKIQEYMSRKDTAVIYPEPVQEGSEQRLDVWEAKQGELAETG